METTIRISNVLINPRRSAMCRFCEINANLRHTKEERHLSTQTRKQSVQNACVRDEKWTQELLVVARLDSWNVRVSENASFDLGGYRGFFYSEFFVCCRRPFVTTSQSRFGKSAKPSVDFRRRDNNCGIVRSW